MMLFSCSRAKCGHTHSLTHTMNPLYTHTTEPSLHTNRPLLTYTHNRPPLHTHREANCVEYHTSAMWGQVPLDSGCHPKSHVCLVQHIRCQHHIKLIRWRDRWRERCVLVVFWHCWDSALGSMGVCRDSVGVDRVGVDRVGVDCVGVDMDCICFSVCGHSNFIVVVCSAERVPLAGGSTRGGGCAGGA